MLNVGNFLLLKFTIILTHFNFHCFFTKKFWDWPNKETDNERKNRETCVMFNKLFVSVLLLKGLKRYRWWYKVCINFKHFHCQFYLLDHLDFLLQHIYNLHQWTNQKQACNIYSSVSMATLTHHSTRHSILSAPRDCVIVAGNSFYHQLWPKHKKS